MSSESTSYYVVERNIQLEEERRQAALAAARTCATEFRATRTALNKLCEEYQDVGLTSDLPAEPEMNQFNLSARAGAESYLAAWRAATSDAQLSLRRAQSQGSTRRFLAQLEVPANQRSIEELLGESQVARPQVATQPLREELDRILSDTIAEPAELARLCSDATIILKSTDGSASIAASLASFRDRAREITASARQRACDVDEATVLLVGLAGLPGREIEDVRLALARVKAGTERLSSMLRSRVASAAEVATASANARWVAKLVGDKLTELGYQVESDFATESFRKGSLQALKTDWSESDGTILHEVQIDLELDDAGVMVCDAEVLHERNDALAEQRQNIRVEEQWCQDHFQLLQHLRERSIRVEVDASTLIRPGARDSSRVHSPSMRSRHKRRPRSKARERDR